MKLRSDENRRELLAGVTGRRREIGLAVLSRVQTIGATDRDVDAEYLEGVRQAVETAIDYTIESAAGADDRAPSTPVAVIAQARLAARRRTPLETVLRRYLAGHTALGDFLIEESGRRGTAPPVLRQVLRSQAAATDRVLATISATYAEEEASARPVSTDRRRAARVRRLLDGELLDPSGLDYELDRWHTGLIVRGLVSGPTDNFAPRLDANRLVISGDDGLLWVWFGSRSKLQPDRIVAALPAELLANCRIGIGEPAQQRSGWRLTHEQARAALTVAVRGTDSTACYANVAVVASALRDELLTTSLRSLYVDPLEADRESGTVLRETLHAYLEADRNVTSAAASLGVSRNTVTNRLRTVEARIGHLRTSNAGDLALALRLDALA